MHQGDDQRRPAQADQVAGGVHHLGRKGGQRHQHDIAAADKPRHAGMAPAVPHRALIKMTGMGLPDFLAVQRPGGDGDGGVGQVVGGQGQGGDPVSPHGQGHQQPAEKEAKRHRADVAQEYPGGMPIENQEAAGGGPKDQPGQPGHGGGGAPLDADQGRQHENAEADGGGLDPGEAVDPVHEIEKVHEPYPGEAGEQAIQRQWDKALEQGEFAGDEGEHHGDASDMDREPRRHGHAAEIVQARDNGHRQGAAEDHPGNGIAGAVEPDQGGDHRPRHGQYGDAAAPGDRLAMAGAPVGGVEHGPADQPGGDPTG